MFKPVSHGPRQHKNRKQNKTIQNNNNGNNNLFDDSKSQDNPLLQNPTSTPTLHVDTGNNSVSDHAKYSLAGDLLSTPSQSIKNTGSGYNQINPDMNPLSNKDDLLGLSGNNKNKTGYSQINKDRNTENPLLPNQTNDVDTDNNSDILASENDLLSTPKNLSSNSKNKTGYSQINKDINPLSNKDAVSGLSGNNKNKTDYSQINASINLSRIELCEQKKPKIRPKEKFINHYTELTQQNRDGNHPVYSNDAYFVKRAKSEKEKNMIKSEKYNIKYIVPASLKNAGLFPKIIESDLGLFVQEKDKKVNLKPSEILVENNLLKKGEKIAFDMKVAPIFHEGAYKKATDESSALLKSIKMKAVNIYNASDIIYKGGYSQGGKFMPQLLEFLENAYNKKGTPVGKKISLLKHMESQMRTLISSLKKEGVAFPGMSLAGVYSPDKPGLVFFDTPYVVKTAKSNVIGDISVDDDLVNKFIDNLEKIKQVLIDVRLEYKEMSDSGYKNLEELRANTLYSK
ncbi:MAG: hypothetical protein GY730_05490 [bacterium]|nr:hypothetical protein [bacterium]